MWVFRFYRNGCYRSASLAVSGSRIGAMTDPLNLSTEIRASLAVPQILFPADSIIRPRNIPENHSCDCFSRGPLFRKRITARQTWHFFVKSSYYNNQWGSKGSVLSCAHIEPTPSILSSLAGTFFQCAFIGGEGSVTFSTPPA